MSVRLKISLTLGLLGVVTALAVMLTVFVAFQRFEQETTYRRADAFLGRVVDVHGDLFEVQARRTREEFQAFLTNLLLFEPDSQLYLLDREGTVLACSGDVKLPSGFRVDVGPVREAAGPHASAYVMGDDPERMDADAVVAARAVRRATIAAQGAGDPDAVAGYLYLVAHKPSRAPGGWALLTTSFTGPALCLIFGIVAFTTALAAWVVASLTRPLRQLTGAVGQFTRRGNVEGLADGMAAADGLAAAERALPPAGRDEFGLLTRAFAEMLATLRRQWDALRRLDHFRREAVSNLSHDLRSPLTATAGCLETLEARWAAQGAPDDDRRLVEVALRNSRNAARLVQSLGDLATLDEPAYPLQRVSVDLRELLDDIALRFAERATQQGVDLRCEPTEQPVPAQVDVELFERAIANVVDNALKYCGHGCEVRLSVQTLDGRAIVAVDDTGPGIPPEDLPHLFDRFYQARSRAAPAMGEGGRGLGLTIVKRIVELHNGQTTVQSGARAGTSVHISVPLDRE
jgi:signal transduction histidine kinase